MRRWLETSLTLVVGIAVGSASLHASARSDARAHLDFGNKVAAQGRRIMGLGNWVIMFPEGTRIARGERGSYKTGASRLAIATGVPIVPIAVNSARCWPRRSFLLRPGLVTISIGQPIASEGRAPEELMRQVEDWIETEMHRLDPEAYPAGA